MPGKHVSNPDLKFPAVGNLLGVNKLPERRLEKRSVECGALVLKIGLLEQGERACFCLVKNVSGSGVKVKSFGRLTVGGSIRVEMADLETFEGQVIWQSGQNAGIKFSRKIDATLLLERARLPKEQRRRSLPRLRAEAPAILRTGGRTYSAHVSDISTMGAKIHTNRPVVAGAVAFILIAQLPPMRVFLRWIDDCDVGLAFSVPLPMELIAHWCDQVRLSGTGAPRASA